MEPTYKAPASPQGAELPAPVEIMPTAREIPQVPQAEVAPVKSVEKGATTHERKTPTLDRRPAARPAADDNTTQQDSSVVQNTTPPSTQQHADSDSPAVAGDVDLLEKEWVNKAKQVVEENREDPYIQEKEVSKLQASYLKKRYGKDIKLPKD